MSNANSHPRGASISAVNAAWHDRSSNQLLTAIAEANIVGMGGGGFPAAQKLRLALAQPVHAIVANGVECEPGISCDEALLSQALESVLTGLAIVRHIAGGGAQPTPAVLAYAADFDSSLTHQLEQRLPASTGPDAVTAVNALSRCPVTRYPGAGAERALCELLFQQPIPAQRYPSDYGLLCFNVATLHAIAEAVVHGRKLQQRLVTVAGQNRWLALGTSVSQALSQALEDTAPPKTTGQAHNALEFIQVGGHYTGAVVPLPAVVTATTNALWPTSPTPATPCTQCGLCADACPVDILPQRLIQSCTTPNQTTPTELGLWQCLDCGVCNSVCPSNIDLLNSFVAQKQGERQQASTQQAAALAQQRYSRHQARTEQRTAAVEQRREQRRQRQQQARRREW